MRLYFFIILALSLIFVIFAHGESLAQRLRKTKALRPAETEGYVSGGIQLNALHLIGDIPAGIPFTRPGLGAYLTRKLGPRIHARLGVSYGRLEADDFSSEPTSLTYARNLHVRNDILELTLTGTWDLIPSYGKHFKRAPFTPYAMAGIGVIHHNPQARLSPTQGGEWVALQPLGTEGQGQIGFAEPYNLIQLVLPVGGGLKFALSERFSMNIEAGIRFTFTDYLDDVSGNYPAPDAFAHPLAVMLSNRSLENTAARTQQDRELNALIERFGITQYTGNNGQVFTSLGGISPDGLSRGTTRNKDFYLVTGIHLNYILDVGLKCPQFR